MDVSALKRDLVGLKIDDNPAIVQQKSRDFYWYSPVLKRQLDHVTGDLIVTPRNEAELVRVLAACHRHGVPVTPRGSGTGNYGQAMPLSGGVVLNLAEMKEIKSIAPGRVVTGPGAILADIDKATRAHSGQELRLSPSTYNTASIGGFIAGGSGGVGSINFGGLRDFGNVLRLRVVTMEAEPKALELTGEDLHKVTHAYGTNGIITEVEMPLTAAYEWVDVIVGFDKFMDAARYGNALACQDGILTKLITPIAAPVPQLYFKRHQKFLREGQSICVVMVARHGLDAFLAFTRRAGGELIFNAATATPEEKKGLPPAYELAWNHTTLRALRVDPSITYLQSLYPFPNQLALVEKMDAMFPGEVFSHLEFVRLDGNITCFGLPLVKFTTEARLDGIIRLHEDNGCPIFNPHRYTLEEGGMKQTDAVQLAFKRETDPQGLLNPGKMIAWENPDYDYRSGRTFLFRGLQRVG
ncbi:MULTISPECIES: FAD-binding oxidoreductase [Mesorhizobium]|uniref:FAD-binding oxidoreductase n=1 Tax=Mesorhizobium TaxID=68287 RepID=UPI0004CFE26F|nr:MULTISPECIES: FAD-binding oxidoreductase [Mesorhizobium]WJI41937.1 FAD-binding oxidoreductase [Mesorhizobium opportunistum]